jgi:hypothetical protein
MIKNYESFLDIFKRKKIPKEPNKNNLIEIYNKMKEISNIVFYNMSEFIVKNSTGGDMTEPYVQIFKTKDERPFIFRDLKDYIVNFFNRMNNENINLEFRMTFKNEKGGLSVVGATYQDIESGLYDEKEIIILTMCAKC